MITSHLNRSYAFWIVRGLHTQFFWTLPSIYYCCFTL